MPGFTHLQVAQPVTLGHHLMAYYEMTRRDSSRFADARVRMNRCRSAARRWRAPASRSIGLRPQRRSASMRRPTIRSTRCPIAISRSIT
jgi:hypothetical protein